MRIPQLGFAAQQLLLASLDFSGAKVKSENAIANDNVAIHPKFRFMGRSSRVNRLSKQVTKAVEAMVSDPTVNHVRTYETRLLLNLVRNEIA